MDEQSLERLFRRIMAEHEGPLPQVLSMERAAKELSIGITKLKRLVRDGVVLTCTVGLRRMIPSSEVRKLAVPASTKAPGVRPRKTRRGENDEEVRKILEIAKRRRARKS